MSNINKSLKRPLQEDTMMSQAKKLKTTFTIHKRKKCDSLSSSKSSSSSCSNSPQSGEEQPTHYVSITDKLLKDISQLRGKTGQLNFEQPHTRVQSLLGSDIDLLSSPQYQGTMLLDNNISQCITSAYDFKFVVNSSTTAVPTFVFGMDNGRVYQYKTQRWEMVADNRMRFQLPENTLILAELANELEGETLSSNKMVTTLHIIDALFIAGEDLRQLDFKSRSDKIRALCENMNKSAAHSNNILLRPKEVFGLEKLVAVMGMLKRRLVKDNNNNSNDNNKTVMTMDVECNSNNSSYFIPSGITLFRIVQHPYTMAVSKSQGGKKYFFHKLKNESSFSCPPDAFVGFTSSFKQRLTWKWGAGVRIDEQMESSPVNLQLVQPADFEFLLNELIK